MATNGAIRTSLKVPGPRMDPRINHWDHHISGCWAGNVCPQLIAFVHKSPIIVPRDREKKDPARPCHCAAAPGRVPHCGTGAFNLRTHIISVPGWPLMPLERSTKLIAAESPLLFQTGYHRSPLSSCRQSSPPRTQGPAIKLETDAPFRHFDNYCSYVVGLKLPPKIK